MIPKYFDNLSGDIWLEYRASHLSQRGREWIWAYVALQPAIAHRLDEGRIIALDLIGVRNGVVSDRLVELVGAAQIPRNHCRITRLVVRPRQRQATERGVSPQHPRRRAF